VVLNNPNTSGTATQARIGFKTGLTTSTNGFTIGTNSFRNAVLTNDEGADMLFATAGSERLRLKYDGTVAVYGTNYMTATGTVYTHKSASFSGTTTLTFGATASAYQYTLGASYQNAVVDTVPPPGHYTYAFTATNAGNTHNFTGTIHLVLSGSSLVYNEVTILTKGSSVTSLASNGTPATNLQAVFATAPTGYTFALTLNSTFATTGNATVSGNLEVGGNLGLTGSLTTGGASTVNGTLTLVDAAATDTAMAMKIAGATTNITAAQVKGLGDGYLPLAGGTMSMHSTSRQRHVSAHLEQYQRASANGVSRHNLERCWTVPRGSGFYERTCIRKLPLNNAETWTYDVLYQQQRENEN
jgi:hypothetical protein